MTIRKITYIGLILLVIGCVSSKAVEEEIYDSITTTIYTNIHNIDFQLSNIYITEKTEMYIDGKYVLASVIHKENKYTYLDSGICEFIEVSDLFLQEYSVSRSNDLFEEYYAVDSLSDTVQYNLVKYLDGDRTKPEYRRTKWIHSGFPITDFERNDNNETQYFYNEFDKTDKVIEHDFNTGETIETYMFENLTYDEAVKLVPKSKNIQHVVCLFEKSVGDTLISNKFKDGKLSWMTKKYTHQGKTIEVDFDADIGINRTITHYHENGIDIVVEENSQGCVVDSTYSIKGKPIRTVSIFPTSKTIILSKYDDNGYLIMEIKKSKHSTTISDEGFEEMVRSYKETTNNKFIDH